jgi:hypothetical protein
MSLYKPLGAVDVSFSGSADLELPVGDGGGGGPSLSWRSVLSLLVPLQPLVPTLEVELDHEEGTKLELAGGSVLLFSDHFEAAAAALLRDLDDPRWGAILKVTWQRELTR